MDPTRFDALARSFAAPWTRRGLIGSLAAEGAGPLGARATNAQVSQASCGNVVCYDRAAQTVDTACNPGCVCCAYPNGNSRCRPPLDCTAPGFVIPAPTTTTAAPTNPCGGNPNCQQFPTANGFCACATNNSVSSGCATDTDCVNQGLGFNVCVGAWPGCNNSGTCRRLCSTA